MANGMNRHDYEAEAVEAAKSVILELFRALGEYRENMVLVGGWVPDLLFPHASPKHVGSMDVDIALNHRKFDDEGYRTVAEYLKLRGYEQDVKQPFIYRKKITATVVVQVDLLSGEYQGTKKQHRTQKVQDVKPRKARGCDFAFESYIEMPFIGKLPSGARDSTTIRIASVVAFLVMKGMALADRLKEKDGYDVYFCVKNFPGGVHALAKEFVPYVSHGLVKEGLKKLSEKFKTIDSYGPQSVPTFENLADLEERERLARDAFEQVHALLKALES